MTAMKVDFDVLGGHEDEIREIAGKVQQALDAAGSAQALDFDAFGIVGQVFAVPIQAWVDTADGFLGSAVEAGHDVADRVKTAHAAFSEHEQNTKNLIEGIGKELPA
ncbi:type VII secretion target [Amycolatopsis sp., V23-08]|uniref:Type VII secretion target n=1 Tax=Amycolatopsis heterodermiae TaxID=3110235 RepID=A0ABU5RJT6_9PSEU|nr:type VII secretion target [Amycolatopsis sp., V23-08]MEA5366562.1 type VII secretion target [Amycolatopsis sp., V23-08]